MSLFLDGIVDIRAGEDLPSGFFMLFHHKLGFRGDVAVAKRGIKLFHQFLRLFQVEAPVASLEN